MDFLKHNHAKECQDKLQISFVQLAREDILRYKIFEQDFFYNIKENAVFLPDEELLELKELVGFEKTNRSSLKQFLKASRRRFWNPCPYTYGEEVYKTDIFPVFRGGTAEVV